MSLLLIYLLIQGKGMNIQKWLLEVIAPPHVHRHVYLRELVFTNGLAPGRLVVKRLRYLIRDVN